MANTNKAQIKWQVQEKPTGMYGCFERRGWPDAHYVGANETPAVRLSCEDDYIPRDVKAGTHKPLTVFVADHSLTPWKWRKMKGEFPTLQAAKAAAQSLLDRVPELKGGK